jgi:hypothetical protein
MVCNVASPFPMTLPVNQCIQHDCREHRGVLGESISYALQCRVLISNNVTINPVNPGPLMSCCNPVHPAQALGESIRYAMQCRVPIYNELTSNPVNPGHLKYPA